MSWFNKYFPKRTRPTPGIRLETEEFVKGIIRSGHLPTPNEHLEIELTGVTYNGTRYGDWVIDVRRPRTQ